MNSVRRFLQNIVSFLLKPRVFLLVSCLIVTVLGPFYVYGRWMTTTGDVTDQAVKTAQIAEASLNGDALSQLGGVAEDLGTPAYVNIKQNLLKMVKIEQDVRFAYIYTIRDGKVYFIADSETPDSKDYSPPGQEYTEASVDCWKAYETGKVIVTGVETDRWGTWVSILVPIIKNGSYETIGVFGMDYPADKWYSTALSHSVQTSLYILGIYIILIGIYIILKKNEKEKKSRWEIQENEKKYHLLSDVTLEGILIHQNGIIKDINPSFAKMFGYEEEEITKKNALELFHEDDRIVMQRNMDSNYDRPYEVRAIRKDGGMFFAEVQGIEYQTQGERLRVSSVRDITERKQDAEALRSSELRLRAITDSAQDAIIMMDPEGLVSFWNPASERIFGYNAKEAIGQRLHKFIVPSRHYDPHMAAFPHYQKTGQGAAIGKTLDLEAIRKDGSEIHVQLSLSAVPMKNGWHSVGILRDVSEQKHAE